MNEGSQSGSSSQEVLRGFLGPEYKPFFGVNDNSTDAAGGSQFNGAAGGDGQSETGAVSAIADVWQRGDKNARGAMPAAVDEAAGAAAIAAGDVHLVPVKNHVRAAPGEKQKPPLTLDRLVKEYATDQRQTTERAIRLGRLSDAWIRVQGERPEHLKLDRSSAVKAICRALVEAKVDRRGAPVNRYIRSYWVARLFGGKAESLSFSALREVQPLIERDRATEEWRIVPAHVDAAKVLWARAISDRLSADSVRAEVRKILPPRSLPIRKKKIRLAVFLRAISGMTADQRRAVVLRCEQENAKGSKPAVA
jgi:hypothetical protein